MSAIPITSLPTNRSAAVLDDLDRAIIGELRANGRITNEELSRRVALSRPAVVGRLKRLHDLGAIRGYTVVADWEMLGYPILTYVQVRTAGRCRDGARHIASIRIDGVVVEECHRTTGEWCLLVKVRARSSNVVETFLDEVMNGAGVQATMTVMALSTV